MLHLPAGERERSDDGARYILMRGGTAVKKSRIGFSIRRAWRTESVGVHLGISSVEADACADVTLLARHADPTSSVPSAGSLPSTQRMTPKNSSACAAPASRRRTAPTRIEAATMRVDTTDAHLIQLEDGESMVQRRLHAFDRRASCPIAGARASTPTFQAGQAFRFQAAVDSGKRSLPVRRLLPRPPAVRSRADFPMAEGAKPFANHISHASSSACRRRDTSSPRGSTGFFEHPRARRSRPNMNCSSGNSNSFTESGFEIVAAPASL